MNVSPAHSQPNSNYLRIAKITVDKARLPEYMVALKAQMEAALRDEKGVLAYTAVADKDRPERITIFETYASKEAYLSHIETVHFRKYKAAVADIVLELELTDVVPIAIQSKEN
ncbi:MAG TPA: antibiotic biosynthesis monooxygenase [Cyclobacteriaceae bacterium]|nr:antibiotic biosynthesis monooxygenase [Cyclobacteriaceae bacterium]